MTSVSNEDSNQPAHPQSESLYSWRNFASLGIQNAPSKDSEQTEEIFAVRTGFKVRFFERCGSDCDVVLIYRIYRKYKLLPEVVSKIAWCVADSVDLDETTCSVWYNLSLNRHNHSSRLSDRWAHWSNNEAYH